ncbi:MAG: hypothetical protein WBH29_04315 [Bacilli bacterium]
MAYLQIENLIMEDYTINLEIENGESVGVFARRKKTVFDFLKIASGINPGKGCFHDGKEIYDNRKYFQNRIFMDFSHTYLTTLRISAISETLRNKYGLSFNKEKFVRIGKDLNIRGETMIGEQYKFTPAGNTFVNYALAQALEKPNIVILNPTHGLNLPEDIDLISRGITAGGAFNTALIGIDRLKAFRGRLHKILLFSDFGTAHVLGAGERLIVFPKEFEPEHPLFLGSEKVIALAGYERDELRKLHKNKIYHELISVYDIEDHL